MLRRKPTALTISPEDLVAFEEAHIYNKALAKFKKTGTDPNGWFKHLNVERNSSSRGGHAHAHAYSHQQQHHDLQSGRNNSDVVGGNPRGNLYAHTTNNNPRSMNTSIAPVIDPNDELKPLPGDKARIVRSREERIVGVGGGGASVMGIGMGNASNPASDIITTNMGFPNPSGGVAAATNNSNNFGGRDTRGVVGDAEDARDGRGGGGGGGRDGGGRGGSRRPQ